MEITHDEGAPDLLIASFLRRHEELYGDDEKHLLCEAWSFLIDKTRGLKRSCGKPYYLHPMRVAEILSEKRIGSQAAAAGFLHNILDVDPACLVEIERQLGSDVASIAQGTARITGMKMGSPSSKQADSIRKMLFAMVDDIRVILVKLADRLDRMRNLTAVPPDGRRAVAREALEVWCPLADRLGISDIKSEMEDLCLKTLNPSAFRQIKSIVAQKKAERAEYLASAVDKIKQKTTDEGIEAQITSRAKHFYSIYQKMTKRGKEPGELYDLFALRLICKSDAECYSLLGIVHGLWKPMEGRFKDYIAMPKSNGYRSLHTTVICEGKPLEIQIRTARMHDIAEHGVASHWLYKQGGSQDAAEQVSVINRLKELKEEHLSDEGFFQRLKSDILGDSVFVFTPMGEVKELPAGSNAIDFAYMIHSGVGEKIVGAKADGKIIPLSKPLLNTQIVEVLTNPKAHPTQGQLETVKTAKARQKIRSWLAANDPTFIDREEVQKREAEAEANAAYSKKVAAKLAEERRAKATGKSLPSGLGKSLVSAFSNVVHKGDLAKQQTSAAQVYSGKVRVEGEADCLVTLAGCCKPAPPCAISGYVSRVRGVTVHRADCLVYLRIPGVQKRSVSVDWEVLQADSGTKERQHKGDKRSVQAARLKGMQKNRYRTQR